MNAPSRFRCAITTAKAAFVHVFAFSFVFIVLGVIALDRMLRYGALEAFRLGNVELPKFMGAHATNVSVLIFCVVAVAMIVIGYLVRYLHYRSFLARLRARGVSDINRDGRTDVFTDRFLDDL